MKKMFDECLMNTVAGWPTGFTTPPECNNKAETTVMFSQFMFTT